MPMISFRFLMNECEDRRWSVHALLRSVVQLSSRPNQIRLMNHLYYDVWSVAQYMGFRAAQLVDLLSCYICRFFTKLKFIISYF